MRSSPGSGHAASARLAPRGGEMLGQHVREPGEALLWKIHGEYYDLRPFCDVHPGGSLALQLCQGTDATDLFEQFRATFVLRLAMTCF